MLGEFGRGGTGDYAACMARKQIEVIARGAWQEQGKLLVCRSLAGGHIYLPGGHVEFDEPASAALEREMLEETGWRVRAGGLIATVESRFTQPGSKTGKPKPHHEINLVFSITPLSTPALYLKCFAWI